MKMEQLSVLDPKAPPSTKKHPLEIKNLVDVFAVFGYTADDFIDRHDQCTIFKRIRGELNDLLRDLSTHTKKYDKAVLLRDRLTLIKREFIDMQGRYEVRRQEHEKHQFQRGVVLARKRTDSSCDARTSDGEREIQHKRDDLEKTHRVERAQLESFLSKLPEPHTKFSKLLLELKDTEKNLSRLRHFEDAKNVYLRADAMEKEERTRNAEVSVSSFFLSYGGDTENRRCIYCCWCRTLCGSKRRSALCYARSRSRSSLSLRRSSWRNAIS